jgi:hypothetical protein
MLDDQEGDGRTVFETERTNKSPLDVDDDLSYLILIEIEEIS